MLTRQRARKGTAYANGERGTYRKFAFSLIEQSSTQSPVSTAC